MRRSDPRLVLLAGMALVAVAGLITWTPGLSFLWPVWWGVVTVWAGVGFFLLYGRRRDRR